MGFELPQTPSKPITAEPAAGLRRDSLTRPAVNSPTEISGEPITIDLPTDFVDEVAPSEDAPADTVPVEAPPAETVPAVTP